MLQAAAAWLAGRAVVAVAVSMAAAVGPTARVQQAAQMAGGGSGSSRRQHGITSRGCSIQAALDGVQGSGHPLRSRH